MDNIREFFNSLPLFLQGLLSLAAILGLGAGAIIAAVFFAAVVGAFIMFLI